MISTDSIEIERRWIIPEMPPAEKLAGSSCNSRSLGVRREQAYPSGVRIVKKHLSQMNEILSDHYLLSVKGDGTLSRPEWETEIPEWVYNQLLSQTKNVLDIIRYFSYSIASGGYGPGHYVLEIDEYHGNLAPLIKVECEFDSEYEAAKFVLPSWIKDPLEVTDNSAFTNSNLVRKTYSDIEHFLK